MHKLAISVLVATIAVAACGGSSKSKTGGSASTTTLASSSTSTTAIGGGGDEFSQLVAKSSKADIKITYSSRGQTLTLAQDGKGKSAYVIAGALIISDGEKTVTCSGTTSSAICTQTSGGAAGGASAPIAALFTGLTQLKPADYGGPPPSEAVAGRGATSVTVKASDFAPVAAAPGGARRARAAAAS